MIGRQIDGEQAEHLEKFMSIHNQQLSAFEEVDKTAFSDAMLVVVGVFVIIGSLALVQFIDDFGRVAS